MRWAERVIAALSSFSFSAVGFNTMTTAHLAPHLDDQILTTAFPPTYFAPLLLRLQLGLSLLLAAWQSYTDPVKDMPVHRFIRIERLGRGNNLITERTCRRYSIDHRRWQRGFATML